MLLSKVFHFDSAHFLPGYEGKCEKLHGHTYKLEITIAGEMNDEGMVLDFARLNRIVQEQVIGILDHNSLNDLMVNPTCEEISLFIWRKLTSEVNLYSIRLWEGKNNSVTVFREDVEAKHKEAS